MRPVQWTKNLVMFVPVVFAEQLLNGDKFWMVFKAIIVFCLASSTIYIFNDIIDRKSDALHPRKKFRPVASGLIRPNLAFLLAWLLGIISVLMSLVWVRSEYLVFMVILYVGLMVIYSLWLKKLPILDAITVAMGFVIKAVAGAVIIEAEFSSFLIVTIISTALLVSFGKRMSEVSELGPEESIKHRAALSDYTPRTLGLILSALVGSTFVSYVLFTHNTSYDALSVKFFELLPPRYKFPQWMMLTIPVAFYALIRYLIITSNKSEEPGQPESLVFRDKGLLGSIIIWGILVLLIIYMP